jgi:hypothetical protein
VIKTLALIKRRASIERSAFREHYESVHVPLALPLLEGLSRYVRYHVETERFGDCGFDVLTAFWYRDKAATDRVFARIEGDEGAAIRQDELLFMDKNGNRFFAVSERDWQSGEEGDQHLFVLISRPAGMSRCDSSSKLAGNHWPRLLARFDRPGFALLRDAFPMSGDDLPYDSVMQVRAEQFSGLESWARSLNAEGYGVTAIGTRLFETKLPAPIRSQVEAGA